MRRVRDNTAADVRRLLGDGMSPSDVATELGISRQLVNYHKSDKTRRSRSRMDPEKAARERARANRKYAEKVLKGVLDD